MRRDDPDPKLHGARVQPDPVPIVQRGVGLRKEKHGQVHLMIRDMETDNTNPYTANQVKENLEKQLVTYAGKVKIEVVPNISNITYGRDVGYKIEQENFDKHIENISATNIRMAQEAIEGKYGV